jgi:hypothetical protein
MGDQSATDVESTVAVLLLSQLTGRMMGDWWVLASNLRSDIESFESMTDVLKVCPMFPVYPPISISSRN